eukprot:SAG11_NODE_4708_length_1797_cov_1.048881_1_plen_122_part_00
MNVGTVSGAVLRPHAALTVPSRSFAKGGTLPSLPKRGKALAFDPYYTGQRIRPTGRKPPFLYIFGTIVRTTVWQSHAHVRTQRRSLTHALRVVQGGLVAFGYLTNPKAEVIVPPPSPHEDI